MTFYIRHKETGQDILLKRIDVKNDLVVVQDDGEEKYMRFVEVIEEYEFRYDIY